MIVHAYRQALLARRIIGSSCERARRRATRPGNGLLYRSRAYRLSHELSARGKEIPPRDRVFDMQRDRGKIHGGSWDIPADRICGARRGAGAAAANRRAARVAGYGILFEALQRAARRESSGWNIRSRADVDARCRFLDQLIESIRREGYLRSNAVALAGEDKGLQGHPVYGEEVSVNIGRDGQYLFQNGRHRLAIAKILGSAKIPVKVLVRHKQWVEFRNFLAALAGKAASRVGTQGAIPEPDPSGPAGHAV